MYRSIIGSPVKVLFPIHPRFRHGLPMVESFQPAVAVFLPRIYAVLLCGSRIGEEVGRWELHREVSVVWRPLVKASVIYLSQTTRHGTPPWLDWRARVLDVRGESRRTSRLHRHRAAATSPMVHVVINHVGAYPT